MGGITEDRRIRDPVHGLIVFDMKDRTDQIAWELLGTREFQRLRRIRQLGFSDFVYPGATHTRFAHSVGVFHIARRMIQIVERKGKKTNAKQKRIALLAALLHDIGHGPFSHVFEHVSKGASHEDWSAAIITGNTEVSRVLKKHDGALPGKIAALLRADEPKDIYGTVVSSQFDADRLDYLQRDRLMTGVQFGQLDTAWLFDCLEVCDMRIPYGDETILQPCLYLNHKGIRVAEEYLEIRFRMYESIYMHKTTRSAERVLRELLDRIKKAPKKSCPGRLAAFLSSSRPTLEDYLSLDDTVVWADLALLKAGKNRELSELANRLLARNLYKCFDLGADVWESDFDSRWAEFKSNLRKKKLEKSVFFDEENITGYKFYEPGSPKFSEKVLVRNKGKQYPVDIGSHSEVVKILLKKQRLVRCYVRTSKEVAKLQEMWSRTNG